MPTCAAAGSPRPSAEARLHLEIVRVRGAGAVLHTHSLWSTLLSDHHAAAGGLAIEGYEMLKGLEGVVSHDHREWIPVLENDQDMMRLAGEVRETLDRYPACQRSFFGATGCTLGETRCRRPCATSKLSSSCSRRPAEMGRVDDHGSYQNPGRERIHRAPAVRTFLATHGIDYEKWPPDRAVDEEAHTETLLAAYGP